MVNEKFNKKNLLITPLATAEVVRELIWEESDSETLEEIIKFSSHLVIEWQKVLVLAEERKKRLTLSRK